MTMYCCAYMTLKSPCQVAQFVAKGGLQTTLEIMTDYTKDMNILVKKSDRNYLDEFMN